MNVSGNNANNNNANNNAGNGVLSEMSAEQLLKKLQALAFAKVECELYLDGHPECGAALDKYRSIIKEYGELASRYENTVAPIRAENISDERWTWVDTPWPWQTADDANER